MVYHNVHVFAQALRLIDSATVGIVTVIVWLVGVRYHYWPANTESAMWLFSASLVITFLITASRLRIYHARRTEHILRELVALSNVAIGATGVSCLVAQTLTPGLPGKMYGASALAGIAALLGLRAIVRLVLRRLRRGGLDYRIWLVVGRNSRSAHIVNEILANPHFGIRIARIIDICKEGAAPAQTPLAQFDAPPLAQIPQSDVQSAEVLREIISAQIIDEVLVTLPLRTFYDDIEQILQLCVEAGISTRFLPETFDRAPHKRKLVPVGDIPLVTHFSGPASQSSLMMKRLLDIVVAATGMVLLFPFFTVVGLLIKLSSPGPVLFRQRRVGLHGRQFRMLKFRTMVDGAPRQQEALTSIKDTDGVAFKLRNDPRITPMGRWLRKYHLDELPQLWNVLTGDMSLVGPRPLPPEEAQGSEWWQRRRLTMAPGLTCHWQVRGDHMIPFRDWMLLDLKYIDDWSLGLDMRILAATVGTMLRGSGW